MAVEFYLFIAAAAALAAVSFRRVKGDRMRRTGSDTGKAGDSPESGSSEDPGRGDPGDETFYRTNEKLLAEIWEREKAQEQLRATAARFKALFELAPDAVFLQSANGTITDANLAAEKIFGYPRRELAGMRIADLTPDGASWPGPGENSEAVSESEGLDKSGRVFPVEVCSRAVELDDGPAVLVVVRDVSLRKQSEHELKTLTLALEQSPAAVVIADPDRRIVFVNPRFTETSGYAGHEVLGQDLRRFHADRMPETFHRKMWDTVSSHRQWRGEICGTTKSGETIWELASISPVTDDSGELLYYVAVKEDITEKKRRERMIRRIALYDSLTGLPNRALLMDRLDLALAQTERSGDNTAVLYLDLDGFKSVNDGFGHETGDAVLSEAGARIGDSIRKSDTAARIGGDEFVIVLRSVQRLEDVDATAKRIIGALNRPFEVSGKTFRLGSSIGVSLAPDHSTDRDELIRLADQAMYRVKEGGKNDYRYYEPLPEGVSSV
jgi:diguanylate cyclase (GGDEF)-like protein/PAS domain S-box-containing protein